MQRIVVVVVLFFVLPFVCFAFHTRDPERQSRSDSYVINLAASPPSSPKFEISASGANSGIYGTQY